MNVLKEIKSPIEKELREFDDFFSSYMKSNVPLLNIVINYILRRKGKQIRPLLVFLTARLLGHVNSSTFTAATLIEFLHTATLIHDDVVDDSNERRGFPSVNFLWKSKIAVLLGDYLLSKGLILSVEKKEFELLEIVSHAVREMSEGELLQIQKSRKMNITEDDYFNIIRKKTAALLSACTACGAKSVTDDEAVLKKMTLFGENLGIAFQIKDDLFDYESTSIIGKPKANDIKEKKLTLPLISSLQNASKSDSKKILKTIRNFKRNRSAFKQIKQFVFDHKGVEYTKNRMIEYKNAALKEIDEYKDNPLHKSLTSLVDYIVSRTK